MSYEKRIDLILDSYAGLEHPRPSFIRIKDTIDDHKAGRHPSDFEAEIQKKAQDPRLSHAIGPETPQELREQIALHEMHEMLTQSCNGTFHLDDHTHFRSPHMKILLNTCIMQFKHVLDSVLAPDEAEMEIEWNHEYKRKNQRHESIIDMFSNNLVFGRYFLGHLLLEYYGTELSSDLDRRSRALKEAPIAFDAYITAVCGANSRTRVEALKNHLLDKLRSDPRYEEIFQVYTLRRHLVDEAKKTGVRARSSVSIMFVSPESPKTLPHNKTPNKIHEYEGKYVILSPEMPLDLPTDVASSNIHLPDATRVTPIPIPEHERPQNGGYLYKSQMVLVFQLDDNLPPPLLELYHETGGQPRRFLSAEEQQRYISWDQLAELPSFVFASFFFGPGAHNRTSMKKYAEAVQETVKVRSAFKRSEIRKNLDLRSGYSVGQRGDQQGHLGNFNNFKTKDRAVQQSIKAYDEMTLDVLDALLFSVIPEFMNDQMHMQAYGSGVPPCGFRGYGTSGAVGKDYLAPQHYEYLSDPLWTLGMGFTKGNADSDSYNIIMGALDGGKGVVGMNYPYSAHIWRGKDILHSGTIGMNTFSHNRPTVGIAMYQKNSLMHQAQHDILIFPQSFKFPLDRDLRYNPGVLKWIL
ncbi:hypothetical protein BS47DRAFT_1362045 [Hydnum rufescens UP504]|uniref:Uncharacterized protein n=1 Tax=Hydnum rufescens UP504 TaxID=1448309 RepID=A0A9P6DWS9_9AGAM|nr:hypothetical protein BS47DRAFT_1362045 [Hydnum rufescens UP504]